jgi:hypothetical protein
MVKKPYIIYMCRGRLLGSISGELSLIRKDFGLCYFMEFAGFVDAGARVSFSLKTSESQLTRFICFQNFFSHSSRSATVTRTTFGVPLGGPKHSVSQEKLPTNFKEEGI